MTRDSAPTHTARRQRRSALPVPASYGQTPGASAEPPAEPDFLTMSDEQLAPLAWLMRQELGGLLQEAFLDLLFPLDPGGLIDLFQVRALRSWETYQDMMSWHEKLQTLSGIVRDEQQMRAQRQQLLQRSNAARRAATVAAAPTPKVTASARRAARPTVAPTVAQPAFPAVPPPSPRDDAPRSHRGFLGAIFLPGNDEADDDGPETDELPVVDPDEDDDSPSGWQNFRERLRKLVTVEPLEDSKTSASEDEE